MKLKFRCWNGKTMVSPDYIDRKGVAYWKENSIPESTDKVMLWTGLLDKEGKEIYEGDIVTADYLVMTSRYKVTIEDGHTQLVHIRNNTLRFFLSKDNVEVYEVIGNIYENPELIKEC